MPSKTPEPVVPEVRKGQGDMHISADVFRERLRERFHDPAFERTSAEIDKIIDIAWRAYQESHKSPRTRAAGEGFADPEMQLSVHGSRHEMRSQRHSASMTIRRQSRAC